MPHAKPAVAIGAAAIVLCGCSSVVKPPQGRGKLDDPRTYASANHLKCMQKAHLPVTEVGATGLQIGPPPQGATVQFEPTPGAAQTAQFKGYPSTQGAEAIGSALLWPHAAPDGELTVIENCLAGGVSG